MSPHSRVTRGGVLTYGNIFLRPQSALARPRPRSEGDEPEPVMRADATATRLGTSVAPEAGTAPPQSRCGSDDESQQQRPEVSLLPPRSLTPESLARSLGFLLREEGAVVAAKEAQEDKDEEARWNH